MTNFQKYLIIIFLGVGIFTAYSIFATSKADITYPVSELGGCKNYDACKSYCDDPTHINECLAFAKEHNLLSQQELEKAEKFQAAGAVGPGGCKSEGECQTYCADISNIDECLAFAEETGMMSPEELEEAQKVAAVLRTGVKTPGDCRTKEQCDAYCGDTTHMRECITFAEQAGLIPPEELKEAKQVLKAIDAGVKLPGNCNGKQACDAYCQDSANMEECVEFGIAAGFIPPEEADEVRRIMPLMKAGKMPGGCKGKEECEAYCSQDANVEECTNFFVEAGFMTPEDAEMFRKTGGKGPGDCKGKEECEAFCQDPQNQQICFDFATEHGLIPEEELENIRSAMQDVKTRLAEAPPEIAQCLKEKIGEDVLNKIAEGTFVPNPELGDHMRSCFEMQQQIIEQQMREQFTNCLPLSCNEFFTCLQSVAMPGGGEGETPPEGEEGQGGGPAMPPEVEQKMQSCIEEIQGSMMPPEGEGVMPPEGVRPPEGEGVMPPEGGTMQPPSQEEIEKIMEEQRRQQEEQMRQQIEEEMRRQQEEQMRQQQPQSLLDIAKNFLAGVSSFFLPH